MIRNRILFILPPPILAVITWIWLFYKDGRWYYYRQEWPFTPLFVLHFLLPAFYLIMFLVFLVKHINKNTRASGDIFYIISSIILVVLCTIGLLSFLIFTSGM